MNPFLTFLVFVPLLVAGFFVLAFVVDLFQQGPRWDNIFALVIFGALFTYLARFLKKTSTPNGSSLALSTGNDLHQPNKRIETLFTAISLWAIYLGLAICALVLFKPEGLQNWIGVIFGFMGLSWLYAGISDFKKGTSGLLFGGNAAVDADILRRLHSSHRTAKNLILLLHPILAVASIWAYWNVSLFRRFSLIDLYGFIFLLSSLIAWAILRDLALRKQIQKIRS